jgi:hypothetical protein
VPVRWVLALAAVLALVSGCGGDSERDALLERIEPWRAEDSILSVVRNHDPFNLGGPTFPDELEEFVGVSSVASFWPIELPDGLVLRGATLTLVDGEPERFDAGFPTSDQTARFQWRVVQGEIDSLTPAGRDTLSLRGGVLIWRWSSVGLDSRIVEATGCGHTLLATFPIGMFSNDDIQRAVGSQFIDCRS